MKIKKILAILLALSLILTVITGCSNDNDRDDDDDNRPKKNAIESLVDSYMYAMRDADSEEITATLHPDYLSFRDDEYADNEYIDYDTYAEYIDEDYEIAADWFADEEDIDLSQIEWEITKIKDVKKGQLKDIQKYFEKTCDIEVKSAKTAKVIIKDGDEKATMELCLIYVGSEWYVSSYEYTANDYEYLIEVFEHQEKMKNN